MSHASLARKYAGLHLDAHRRWLHLVEVVQETGDRGQDTRRAEREMSAAGRREVELGRKAIRAVVAAARAEGIEYSSEVPLAVATPGGMLVISHDERGEPTLVIVPTSRIARG